MRYLDVRTDFAFKKVFGSAESKDILLSFLNAMIRFDDGSQIVDLTIVDPYQIPLIQGMKDSFVDVKAKLSSGHWVIIEMQVLNLEGFEKRILYNAAKAYATQLDSGIPYIALEPVIALTITDFTMFKEFDKVISYFRLLEKEAHIQYSGDVELVFAELPKFTKKEHELSNIIDKWLFFVKNAGSLEYIPETLKSEPAIAHAFDIANTAGMSREEMEAQSKRIDFMRVQRQLHKQLEETREKLQKAETDWQKVETERQKAETERQKAETERQKAEDALETTWRQGALIGEIRMMQRLLGQAVTPDADLQKRTWDDLSALQQKLALLIQTKA